MEGFLLPAIIIFLLRVVDITVYTLRILMVMRGYKIYAWLLGFSQSILFLYTIKIVLTDSNNWLNIVGYAMGFASGLVLGIIIEDFLRFGFLHVRIISKNRGSQIAETLRGAGYGVTEIAAFGKDGNVDLLHSSIRKSEKNKLFLLVEDIDDCAFITAENVRPIQHGYWGTRLNKS